MKLVMPLPTRGRPALLRETLAQIVGNATHPNTVIMVQIDADDQPTIEALTPKGDLDWGRVIVDVREREDTIAGKINRAMEVPADVYCVGADDDYPATQGWDQKILEASLLFP